MTTVLWQGWSGKRNGELLQEAEAEFDALVTMDKSIEHQQNLQKIDLAIVVIEAKSNRLADVQPAMPEVNQVLRSIQPRQVIYVIAS